MRCPGERRSRPQEVARLLQEHPDAVAVFTTLLETSTGVGHDIEAIGRVVGPSKALLVVDGISGVGAMECRTDAWGIDVLVVGAQKALMTPPGLAFLAVSPAAWQQIESIRRPAFYFDLLAYRKALKESDTPYTPAIPLVKALAESLRTIRGGGNRADLGAGAGFGPGHPGGDRGPGPATGRRPAGRRHDGRLLPRGAGRQAFSRAACRPASA